MFVASGTLMMPSLGAGRTRRFIHRSAWNTHSRKLGFRSIGFSEVRLRIELLLYHGLCWPRCGYGIRVAMHHLPGTILRPKDRGNPQGNRGDIIPPLELGLASLYLHRVGKLSGRVLRYVLKACGLAIPELRCGTLQGLSNLIPSTRGGAKGVSEGYIVCMGVTSFITIGTPFHDLI